MYELSKVLIFISVSLFVLRSEFFLRDVQSSTLFLRNFISWNYFKSCMTSLVKCIFFAMLTYSACAKKKKDKGTFRTRHHVYVLCVCIVRTAHMNDSAYIWYTCTFHLCAWHIQLYNIDTVPMFMNGKFLNIWNNNSGYLHNQSLVVIGIHLSNLPKE